MKKVCPKCGAEEAYLVDNVSNPLDPTYYCPVCRTTFEESSDQTAKADAGKLKLSLVPTQIIRDIAEVREYGNNKYGSPDNWKNVEIQRYRDALFRHLLAYLDDPFGVDEESGIEHYKHMACNMAFLCEMEKWEE